MAITIITSAGQCDGPRLGMTEWGAGAGGRGCQGGVNAHEIADRSFGHQSSIFRRESGLFGAWVRFVFLVKDTILMFFSRLDSGLVVCCLFVVVVVNLCLGGGAWWWCCVCVCVEGVNGGGGGYRRWCSWCCGGASKEN